MDGNANITGQMYLRTPDGAVYGPVEMVTLCGWATDARIVPGCDVSSDKTKWVPADAVPELRLNWMIRLRDGSTHGPLNLLAIWALAQDDPTHRGLHVVERGTQRSAVLDATLYPLLIEEARSMLASDGRLAAGLAAQLRANREGDAAARDARTRESAAAGRKLADTERQLAEATRRAAELDRRLGEKESLLRTVQGEKEKASEAEARLAETLRRAHDAERRLAAAVQEARDARARGDTLDREMGALRTETAELKARLADAGKREQDVLQNLRDIQARGESGRQAAAGAYVEVAEVRARWEDAERRAQTADQAAKDARGRCDAVTAEVAGLREEVAGARRRIEEAEHANADLKQQLATGAVRSDERVREGARVQAELATARSNLEIAEGREKDTQRRLDESRGTVDTLAAELGEVRGALAASEAHRHTAGQQLADAERRQRELSTRAEEVARQANTATVELGATRLRLEEACKRGDEAARRVQEFQTRTTQLETDLAAVRSELATSKTRLERELAESRAEAITTQTQLTETAEREAAALVRARERDERATRWEAEAAAARGELAAARAQLAESERLGAEFRTSLSEALTREEVSVRLVGTLRAQASASEDHQRELERRLDAAQREAETLGASVRSEAERAAHAEKARAADVERLGAKVAGLEAERDAEKAARLSGEAERDATIAELRGQLGRWEDRLQALLGDVKRLEGVLEAREDEYAAFRREAERTEAELTARIAAQRKDTDSAARGLQEARDQCLRAQSEAIQERERAASIEKGLRDELAGLKKDLGAMMVASDVVRRVAKDRKSSKPAAIDWMDQQSGASGEKGPSAAEQVELLNQKLCVFAEEKEKLRQSLDGLRTTHEDLKRDAGEREAKLQAEIKSTAALLAQALEETERREGQLRALRKKSEDREQELLARIADVEAAAQPAEVVEPEVIGPGGWDQRPAGEGQGTADARPADGRRGGIDMLTSVEAQLRAELRKWEALSQGGNGKTRKWFGRKSS